MAYHLSKYAENFMFQLNNEDLPAIAEIPSPAPIITIAGGKGDVFSIDPLAQLKRVSNAFAIPVVPNPPWSPRGYLYRFPKDDTATIVSMTGIRDWWQTPEYVYAIVPERQTIAYTVESTSFVFPIYDSAQYGFELEEASLMEGATITSLSVGGSVYQIGANLIQSGNTLTFIPLENIRDAEPITLKGSNSYNGNPYAIVHQMSFSETDLQEVVEIQHLAFTYQRSFRNNYSLYQFRWDIETRIVDLFLPMDWEFTLFSREQRSSFALTKGIWNFNG